MPSASTPTTWSSPITRGSPRQTRDPYSFLPTLGETDLYLFGQGNELRIYEKLGAQLRVIDGVHGTSFAVWAPNAQRVSVVGDFNDWDGRCHPMRSLGPSGVWEIFIPGVGEGAHYKYEIRDIHGHIKLKTDPVRVLLRSAAQERRHCLGQSTSSTGPTTSGWSSGRKQIRSARPMSIYEVHFGSWRKKSLAESLSYRELAEPLAEYVKRDGLHACGIHAGGRARFLSLLGLSGHRVLCADQPLRHARTTSNFWSTPCMKRALA